MLGGMKTFPPSKARKCLYRRDVTNRPNASPISSAVAMLKMLPKMNSSSTDHRVWFRSRFGTYDSATACLNDAAAKIPVNPAITSVSAAFILPTIPFLLEWCDLCWCAASCRLARSQ